MTVPVKFVLLGMVTGMADEHLLMYFGSRLTVMLPALEPEIRPPLAETVKPVIWPCVELPDEFEV